jgi:hypothetical protein
MLATIFSTIGMPLINGILDKALDAFRAYENKQISVEQLKDQLYGLMLGAIKDIEVSHSETLAKTYASFMDAMKTSVLLQRVWAVVVLSQTFVLFWAQWCAPILYAYGFMDRGWHAGGTVEWAYLLVGALLGMGPMVLRSGPGAGNIAERLRGLLGK